MKFLIDQQLPPALSDWLRARGHEATHVSALGMGEADDGRIWDMALREGAVVVTKDADFGERRHRQAQGPSILWLRIGNTTSAALFAALDRNWKQIEAELAVDAVVEVL